MLPTAIAMGIKYKEFMHLNPMKLRAIGKGYRLKRKLEDERDWMLGFYIMKGFETVMSHFGSGLSGKKSDAKYLEYPFMQQEEFNKKNLQKQRELFVAQLEQMKMNFELAKQGDSVS